MAAARKSEALPLPLLVATDVMAGLLSVGPGLVGWLTVPLVLHHFRGALAEAPWLWSSLVLAPAVAAVVLIGGIALVRAVTPKMAASAVPLGLNRAMVSWYLQMALGRAAKVAGLWGLIHRVGALRALYYRALGARVGRGVRFGRGVQILEAPLVTIGDGTTLADDVIVTCHVFVGDKLLLRPVVIGARVVVGPRSRIAPSSTIGDGARVGADSVVGADRIAPGTVIEDQAWRHGNPQKVRGARARPAPAAADPGTG